MSTPSTTPRSPTMMVILDGFGTNPCRINNGIAEANTPRLDQLFSTNPHTLLQASGAAVGLPDGQMGNSEVGHLTIGSGLIVRQDLVVIDDAIKDGSFFTNETLLATLAKAKAGRGRVHIIGLVSEGGVHSHTRHLNAMLQLAHQQGVKSLVHMITDGRDVPPQSAKVSLDAIEPVLQATNGQIVTVAGRYYSMDRDNRWDRVKLAWDCMVKGLGEAATTATEAIEQSYQRGENDEFIKPTLLDGFEPIEASDQVIFLNFRRDRPRQIVSSLYAESFDGFPRESFTPIDVTCITKYDDRFGLPYAFEQERSVTTLAEEISNVGLKQFHCAETEKYPHITFFLNGSRNEPFPGEKQVIIPSPRVATYDLQPEMSAAEVTDVVIEAARSGQYDFIAVNYANGDMVGHTAVREAVLKAVETLDHEVGRLMDVAKELDYSVLMTSDHGNCEELIDPVAGTPQTQHSVYPVPCLIIDKENRSLSIGAGLSSIAPTVLQLMGLEIPAGMSGHSLLLE
ncbi:MAG: 2,3-bisphosphoglycerate-independent phosphoglycerate mutase [Candidatus Polarisedimenticolaceae bacterium]|nr:2,3-bisphosphoglycerate-independent phosphoglycerate mutase [Candidatus Polarisedimenticolaceae bacterium]